MYQWIYRADFSKHVSFFIYPGQVCRVSFYSRPVPLIPLVIFQNCSWLSLQPDSLTGTTYMMYNIKNLHPQDVLMNLQSWIERIVDFRPLWMMFRFSQFSFRMFCSSCEILIWNEWNATISMLYTLLWHMISEDLCFSNNVILMMQSLIGTYYHHSGGFGKTSIDWFLVIPGEIRTLLMSIFSICLMLAQWENAWGLHFLNKSENIIFYLMSLSEEKKDDEEENTWKGHGYQTF